MSGFIDVYLPPNIRAFPWTSSPKWSTTITQVSSGSEHRNQNWQNPLHSFKASQAVRCHEQLEDLLDHWMAMAGPAYAFPMQDPMDFASARLRKVNLAPAIAGTDQVLGEGNGVQTVFNLRKAYVRGPKTYYRPITLPVVETVEVLINALPPSDGSLPGGPYTWDVIRDTGEVIFDHAVADTAIVTAGFLFDVPVRFLADDSFDRVVSAFEVDGFADLDFVEIRPCASGVLG